MITPVTIGLIINGAAVQPEKNSKHKDKNSNSFFIGSSYDMYCRHHQKKENQP